MNKEQKAARDAAWQSLLRPEIIGEDGSNLKAIDNFDTGFDTGYAAREDAWVAVSDRLPSEPGPHIFKQIGDDDMYDCLYLGLNTISDKAEYLKSHYVAWMPIPKYQPTEGE